MEWGIEAVPTIKIFSFCKRNDWQGKADLYFVLSLFSSAFTLRKKALFTLTFSTLDICPSLSHYSQKFKISPYIPLRQNAYNCLSVTCSSKF